MSKLTPQKSVPHTKALPLLDKYLAENKEDIIGRLSMCSSVTKCTSIITELINDATSDYSIYGRELTFAQNRSMGELVAVIELALLATQCISFTIPSVDDLSASIRQNLHERIDRSLIKTIVHSIFSTLGLYESPRREDLPESLARLEINTEELFVSIKQLIVKVDEIVEKCSPSKPSEELKMKPREIEGDILLVLQETLGALHLPENSSILAKKSTRIESTLKSYRISVEWPSDGDYSNLDILDEKYDLIFDPELPQTIIATKPCLLRCEDVLLKGELLIKRQ